MNTQYENQKRIEKEKENIKYKKQRFCFVEEDNIDWEDNDCEDNIDCEEIVKILKNKEKYDLNYKRNKIIVDVTLSAKIHAIQKQIGIISAIAISATVKILV